MDQPLSLIRSRINAASGFMTGASARRLGMSSSPQTKIRKWRLTTSASQIVQSRKLHGVTDNPDRGVSAERQACHSLDLRKRRGDTHASYLRETRKKETLGEVNQWDVKEAVLWGGSRFRFSRTTTS